MVEHFGQLISGGLCNGADRLEFVESTGEAVVVMAGGKNAVCISDREQSVFNELCDEGGGCDEPGTELAAPLAVLLRHYLGVVAVENDDGLCAARVYCVRALSGLRLDLGGVAHEIGESRAGSRLIGKDGGLYAGLFEQAQQGSCHFRGLYGGNFAYVDESIAFLFGLKYGLFLAVDVSGLLKILDRLHDCGGGYALHDGLCARLADEEGRLIARGAVVGAGVAKQAFIHCLRFVRAKGLAALIHGEKQTLCARGVYLFTGLELHRAKMAAHPAETAFIGVL